MELSAKDDYRRLLLNDKGLAARTAASMAASRGLHPSLASFTIAPSTSSAAGQGHSMVDPSKPFVPVALSRTFLTPLGPQTDTLLDQAWMDIEAESVQSKATHQPGPCSIPVLFGRVLDVPWAAGGVARFRFEDLCARPLGPTDYVALASAFHTVFITDIPVMSMQVMQMGCCQHALRQASQSRGEKTRFLD